MATKTIRLTDEQEAALLFNMKKAGETNQSEYIRQRIMEPPGRADPVAATLQRQVDSLVDSVDKMQKLIGQLVAQKTDDLELKMLAGVYLLLYQSVDQTVRASIDPYLDYRGVKGFLDGGTTRAAPAAPKTSKPRSKT